MARSFRVLTMADAILRGTTLWRQARLVALLGPSGGSILGFIVSASEAGFLGKRGWNRRPRNTALAMAIGNVAVRACGLVQPFPCAGSQCISC